MDLENKIVFDISPVISSRTAVFPGDTAFSQTQLLSFKNGQHLDLSSIQTTVHIGAHTDAPSHYHADGISIEKCDLKNYIGSAQVIRVECKPGARIGLADLKQKAISEERILFRTDSFPDPDKWNDDFVSLSAEVIDYLAAQKVKLVGIDTPSVDPAQDQNLESHKAIYKNKMSVLEGIVLSEIPEGLYELICLPLKIEGSDASPVRAVLLK